MALTRLKYLLVTLILLLAAFSYGYNDFLIKRLLELEKQSVELWARAIEFNSLILQDETDQALSDAIKLIDNQVGKSHSRDESTVYQTLSELLRKVENGRNSFDFVTSELIIKERVRVPMVVVDEAGEIVASRFVEDIQLTAEFVDKLAGIHEPIEILIGSRENPETQYVYYGESNLVSTLRYFPYIQFGFILLLIGIGYTSYRSIINSEQSNLWVGMTKEAAHQLGTPLSGMYGWIELLRDKLQTGSKSQDEGGIGELSDIQRSEGHRSWEKELEILSELEQDVHRLSTVADRFNKIGSSTDLHPTLLKEHLEQSVQYMRRRLPKTGIDIILTFSDQLDEKFRKPALNPVLFQWVIENLIKNAADASSKTIELIVGGESDHLIIDVMDDGSGIDKKLWKEIFRPGYSTKKRGWGLGLTLTKRIVEQYHKGKILVLRSEPGKGTTIRILIPV